MDTAGGAPSVAGAPTIGGASAIAGASSIAGAAMDAGTPIEPLPADVLAVITVNAGEHTRERSIVRLDYPDAPSEDLALRDAEGALHPVQLEGASTLTFILPSLAAGEQADFQLVLASQPFAEDATVVDADGVLSLRVGGNDVVGFQVAAPPPMVTDPGSVRSGYLHPFFTPSGTLVTGDYPEDHEWHHGIWSAWARASFNGHIVDFWNSYKNEGRVDLEAVDATWQGPVHAGVDARLAHVDLLGTEPMTALAERWVVRVYKTHDGVAPYHLIELESTQQTAGALPVALLEFEEGETYGGFAIRGHEEWRDSMAQFLTSEGDDIMTADDTNGRWCFIGGDVAGQHAGFAALGHPANFRAAQRMRVHPTDPYVAFSPVKEGDFTIDPGTTYVTRFRYVSTDGAPDPVLYDRLWNDYATPPEVTVSARP